MPIWPSSWEACHGSLAWIVRNYLPQTQAFLRHKESTSKRLPKRQSNAQLSPILPAPTVWCLHSMHPLFHARTSLPLRGLITIGSLGKFLSFSTASRSNQRMQFCGATILGSSTATSANCRLRGFLLSLQAARLSSLIWQTSKRSCMKEEALSYKNPMETLTFHRLKPQLIIFAIGFWGATTQFRWEQCLTLTSMECPKGCVSRCLHVAWGEGSTRWWSMRYSSSSKRGLVRIVSSCQSREHWLSLICLLIHERIKPNTRIQSDHLSPNFMNYQLLLRFHSLITLSFCSFNTTRDCEYSSSIFSFLRSSSSNIVWYTPRYFLVSSKAFPIFDFYCICIAYSSLLEVLYLLPILAFSSQRIRSIFLRYCIQNYSTALSYFSFLRLYIRDVRLLHIARRVYSSSSSFLQSFSFEFTISIR